MSLSLFVWSGTLRGVIFGSSLAPASSAQPASWISGSWPTDEWGNWDVAWLVPDVYEAYLEIDAPPSDTDDWWASYRDLFARIAEIGAAQSGTPDLAWYAIWEGHGFNQQFELELNALPRFARPDRTYHLLSGEVAAVTGLTWPGEPTQWLRPDLWWPADRVWFVATDVDFWRVYVGGNASFLPEVSSAVPTSSRLVPLDHRLVPED